jgi:L-2-hydroxyglutarate oxidase LhgO
MLAFYQNFAKIKTGVKLEKSFWSLIEEVKTQKISKEALKEIEEIVNKVVGVIACKGSWAVDYGSALEALKKILEKERVKN